MRVGVMQPYFMPYIGYWQVLNIVDRYVIYDDVNFIKGGWINRNRILINGEPRFINIPMVGASSNKNINEVEVSREKVLKDKIIRKLEMAYQKAPYYHSTMDIMEDIIYFPETNLALFLKHSIEVVCEYLGIKTDLLLSSELSKTTGLKAEERLLDICERLEATEYYNAIGGKSLYSKEKFKEHGMDLFFVKTNDFLYNQFGKESVLNLSIIDVLMFNDVNTIQEQLRNFVLE